MWMIPDEYRCERTTKAILNRSKTSMTTVKLRCVHLRGHMEDTGLLCGFMVPGREAPISMVQS